MIVRTLFFKDREDSFSLLRRQEREPPVIARVTLHGAIWRGLWGCFRFHGQSRVGQRLCLLREKDISPSFHTHNDIALPQVR